MGDILPRPAKLFPFKYGDGHCYGQPEKFSKFEIGAPAPALAGTAHQKMPIAISAEIPYRAVCRPTTRRSMRANTYKTVLCPGFSSNNKGVI